MGAKKQNQGAGKDQTPEQKIAELEAANAKLQADLKKSQKETKAAKPVDPTFEIEEEDEKGKPTGNVVKYRFVAPLFDIDNVQYKASDVIAEENTEVMAKLVAMKSGIIEVVE